MDDRALLDRIVALDLALADLTTRERLDVLELTWLCIASNARNEGLTTPGGFVAEQSRQTEHLARIAEMVGADVPDPEMERLFREGNLEGMLRRVQRARDGQDTH